MFSFIVEDRERVRVRDWTNVSDTISDCGVSGLWLRFESVTMGLTLRFGFSLSLTDIIA